MLILMGHFPFLTKRCLPSIIRPGSGTPLNYRMASSTSTSANLSFFLSVIKIYANNFFLYKQEVHCTENIICSLSPTIRYWSYDAQWNTSGFFTFIINFLYWSYLQRKPTIIYYKKGKVQASLLSLFYTVATARSYSCLAFHYFEPYSVGLRYLISQTSMWTSRAGLAPKLILCLQLPYWTLPLNSMFTVPVFLPWNVSSWWLAS